MPQKRSEKQTFQDVRLAIACSLDGQWTEANISRWLGRRGGIFMSEVTDQTTHLICTVEEYKAKSLKVKQAAKLGQTQCKIVTRDWLEDSLLKDKKLPVKDYQLSAILKNERAKELQNAKIAKGNELAERFVNTNLYHVYADASNFFYEITLTRDDVEAGWEGQKYTLYLFESNAKPHLYQFAAKFYQKLRDSQPKFYRPSETPQKFWTEYENFKAFFLKKTSIGWDQRLIQISLDESLFQYKAPTGGKPVGYVPESGQRKPSSLRVANGQAISPTQIKTEPEEKDVQFAAAIQRLAATQDHACPDAARGEQQHVNQPLTNDQTLAVAMDLDADVMQEEADVDMMGGTGKHETGTRDEAKHGSPEPEEPKQKCPPSVVFCEAPQEAPQNVRTDEDVDADAGENITTPPAQTSPYFAAFATDASALSPSNRLQSQPVTKTLN